MTSKNDVPESGKDLLFEINTEELPATNLADWLESGAENPLKQKADKIMADYRLTFTGSQMWATPRRLVYLFERVSQKQSPKQTLIKVMPKEEAYDAQTQLPTEKVLKILQFKNADIRETIIGDLNGRPYVFIKKTETARRTVVILPEILEKIVRSVAFAKMMKWGKRWPDGSDLYFSRPIRGFLCLYGNETLKKIKVAGIDVNQRTRLFSKSKREELFVKSIPAYFDLMKKKGVTLNQAARKKKIQAALESKAKALKVRLCSDSFLLNEINYMVENPTVVTAPFDAKFLELPAEVLTVSMARKQRLFSVLDNQDRLAGQFLAVLDRGATVSEERFIANNIEDILRAKLQDSLFFYREDLKTLLADRVKMLKDLVFLKGAGSMLQKSERLVQLTKCISEQLGIASDEAQQMEQAAVLCKTDLLTQMVGEFPELQGVMGGYYARLQGIGQAVASAIGEQYLPRTVDDGIPATKAGAILSLLDKWDLIVSCFCLGLEPTSSADPYALRRSAMAVARIIIDHRLDFSLEEITRRNRDCLASHLTHTTKKSEKDVLNALRLFLKDRFKACLIEKGFQADLIEAVMKEGYDRFYRGVEKLKVLREIRTHEDFVKTCKVMERVSNILKGCKDVLPGEVNPSIFREPLEDLLYKKYEESRSAIEQAKQAGNYPRATSLYASAFFDILGEFFAKVFINDEDPELRKNRHALLKLVRDLYTEGIADLSEIRND